MAKPCSFWPISLSFDNIVCTFNHTTVFHNQQACDAIVTTDSGRACLAEETVDGNLPVHLAAMGGHRMLVSKLLHHSQTLEEVPSQLRTKTVDAIMEGLIILRALLIHSL